MSRDGLDLNHVTFSYFDEIGLYNFCLHRFGLYLIIVFLISLHLSVQLWNCSLLYWNVWFSGVSQTSQDVYCVSSNVEPRLRPAKEVCCFMHHVIKFRELFWLSLTQSLFLNHHCFTYQYQFI